MPFRVFPIQLAKAKNKRLQQVKTSITLQASHHASEIGQYLQAPPSSECMNKGQPMA
jgi:hypothetical protein